LALDIRTEAAILRRNFLVTSPLRWFGETGTVPLGMEVTGWSSPYLRVRL